MVWNIWSFFIMIFIMFICNIQKQKAFKRYVRSYKIKIIDSEDPLVQLEASNSSIKDSLRDLLDEVKGFKYLITVKVLLSKYKENRDVEFAPVCFNSTTKKLINSKYMFDKSFQDILYRIEKRIWLGN